MSSDLQWIGFASIAGPVAVLAGIELDSAAGFAAVSLGSQVAISSIVAP